MHVIFVYIYFGLNLICVSLVELQLRLKEEKRKPYFQTVIHDSSHSADQRKPVFDKSEKSKYSTIIMVCEVYSTNSITPREVNVIHVM